MKGFLLFVCVPLCVIAGYFGVEEWNKYQMRTEVYHVVGGCLTTIDRGYRNNSVRADDVAAALKTLFEMVDEYEALNQSLVSDEGRAALKQCRVVAQGLANKLTYFSAIHEEFTSVRMSDKSTLKNKNELDWRLSVIARYKEMAALMKRFNVDFKESMYKQVSNSDAPDIVKRNYFSAVSGIRFGAATIDWSSLAQASQNVADGAEDLYQFLFDSAEFFNLDETQRILFNNELIYREYEKKGKELAYMTTRLDVVYAKAKMQK